LDVNGDGVLAPIDALVIINFLNQASNPEGEEVGLSSETPAPFPFVFLIPVGPLDDSEATERFDYFVVADERRM
jgi:hypothetical protein